MKTKSIWINKVKWKIKKVTNKSYTVFSKQALLLLSISKQALLLLSISKQALLLLSISKQALLLLEHISHVVKMSVSGYRYRWFGPRLLQYVVSLSKTFNPHCCSRLSCEMSTRREHHREGCLFCAMSSPEEISLKMSTYFLYTCALKQVDNHDVINLSLSTHQCIVKKGRQINDTAKPCTYVQWSKRKFSLCKLNDTSMSSSRT